ncbi:MAG: hypothetical protein NTY32_03120 [Bacteroidia bacterium]|nr:hypothetical protein [Bacteroidia bacterium]
MRILILFISILAVLKINAQEHWTSSFVDSITYQYYLEGNWDKVIETGKSAVNQGIDFKFLQQRMGYAYYLKSDFYKSMLHYEKALKFDPSDQGSIQCGKLSPENKRNNHLTAIRPVNALDYEYNYQWNNELNRSDPNYQRIGISSDLGYSFNVYQTFSKFQQNSDYSDSDNEYRSSIQQDEYYVLASKSLSANFGVDVGFHSVKTTIHTDVWVLTLNELTQTETPLTYNGKLWFGDLHYKWNRIHLGISSSYLDMDYNHIIQGGAHLGLAIPGRNNLFLNNSVYLMNDDNDQWVVTKHSIGMVLFKKFWMELSKTFGDQNNFVDLKGMYVFNSFDPTLSKTGLSVFWFATPHFTVFSNYSLETKENTYLNKNYQQNSISGGIVWKL